MRVLHVNTYDFGGASIAAIRLHEGLLKKGVNSNFLFLHTSGRPVEESHVFRRRIPPLVTRLKNRFRLGKNKIDQLNTLAERKKGDYDYISFPITKYDITQSEIYKSADIINLHWVSGFMDWPSFFKKNDKPIVWTFHDLNPMLGIFHYDQDKNNNESKFGSLESEMLSLKKKVLEALQSNIIPVGPSIWMKRRIEESYIFAKYRSHHIPYGVPENIFQPYDKKILKGVLGIPPDKKLLLFVSISTSNERKGLDLLLKAVDGLDNSGFHLLSIGDNSSNFHDSRIFYTGSIQHQEYLRLFYAAADLFIIPSREDNLPNTVLESMACGTPVVGFDVGGIKDMIIPGETGFLAKAEDPIDLKNKINSVLSDEKLGFDMGISSRKQVLAKYALEIQANNYIDLYNSILSH